jgi:hypothetical protein
MQGIKSLIAIFAITLTIIAIPTTSSASPLSVGEPWGKFVFDEQGGFARSCTSIGCLPDPADGINLEDPPWTFSGPGFLIVQDAFRIGDRFQVFDFGSSLGTTSPTTPDAVPSCDSDPIVCFSVPQSSRGIFTLGGGLHSFEIQAIVAPFQGGGGAYLCIDSGQGECGVGRIGGATDIPEPASMLLLGFSLVAGFLWTRRHQLNLKFGLQRAFAWRSARQRKKLI